MNIIAGIARGIKLETIPSLEVRPTPERVRKAIFDSIRDLSGLCVADLYAGSGAMGLEAASRGAAEVLLVEQNKKHVAFIQCNVERLRQVGVTATIELRCADAGKPESYRHLLERPQLIFADPPYSESAREFGRLMKSQIFRQWASGARLLWEMPSGNNDYRAFTEIGDLESEFRSFEGIYFLEVNFP